MADDYNVKIWQTKVLRNGEYNDLMMMHRSQVAPVSFNNWFSHYHPPTRQTKRYLSSLISNAARLISQQPHSAR